ncbi:vitamin K epoxide reductase family protein [Gemmatimonadota bacterium]
MKRLLGILLLSGVLGMPQGLVGQVAPPEPVVHAILFYSPTCPHCHQVINEDLIPLQEQYGSRLVLLGFDTSQSWANDLFYEAIQHFQVPEDRWAVPFLVVGDQVLIGGLEIPARFPSIIENGLAGDGIDLPSVPGMVTFLQEQGIIDPRYPDRRIALQAPPEEAAAAPREEVVTAPPDSSPPVPVEGDPVEEDTLLVDSVGPPGEELPVDSVGAPGGESPVDSVGPPEEESPVDSVPAPTEAAPADTVREPDQAAAPEGDSARRGMADSAPTALDSSPSTSAGSGEPTEPGAAEDPGTPGMAQVEQGPRGAPLDLQTAARGLESMTMWDRFKLDVLGSSFSVAVLLLMVLTLLVRGYPPRVRGKPWPPWVIPLLLAIGAVVAVYLSFVEVTGTPAVCGPVGDCNTVQQSPYARLFGVLPVGVLGLVGYAGIFLLWIWPRMSAKRVTAPAHIGMWGAALIGTLFSVYLTLLEPFVIGATCAWCLTSAVVMTLLLWATAPLAAQVWPVKATPRG